MPVFRLKLFPLSVFLFLIFLSFPASAAEVCSDFLQKLAHKPERVEFMGCSPEMSAQIHVLQATYRVAGRYAAEVESELAIRTHMPRLRFNCCGWESMSDQREYGTIQQPPLSYMVSMASEETVISDRLEWDRVPWFYITVTLPLEEP